MKLSQKLANWLEIKLSSAHQLEKKSSFDRILKYVPENTAGDSIERIVKEDAASLLCSQNYLQHSAVNGRRVAQILIFKRSVCKMMKYKKRCSPLENDYR